MGPPDQVKEMEMARAKVTTSAQILEFCISIRSMNRPSCEASKVGWLKNVIQTSWRLGASILAMRQSRYLLVPRYLRQVRSGRMSRSPDCKGKLQKFRRGGRERKWREIV